MWGAAGGVYGDESPSFRASTPPARPAERPGVTRRAGHWLSVGSEFHARGHLDLSPVPLPGHRLRRRRIEFLIELGDGVFVEHAAVGITDVLTRTAQAVRGRRRLFGQTGANRLTDVQAVVRRAPEPGELSDPAVQVETDRLRLDLYLGPLLAGPVLPLADPQLAGHDDRLPLAEAGGRVTGPRPPAADRVE